MSYCVNCGVELDATAKKCVLCNTPIHNPSQQPDKNAHTPFSQTPVVPTSIKQKFIALIVSYIFLIPNLVCIFLNIFINPEDLWFIYVLSTSLLCWITFVFPFFTNKLHPYLMWGFDTVAIGLYVFVFHAKNLGGEKWYFGIALPTIAIISLCVLYFLYWIRKRSRHWTSKVLHVFVDLVIIFTVLCVCLYLANHIITFDIFLVLDVCCLALVFFWLYANKSKKVRSWLGRKLFV